MINRVNIHPDQRGVPELEYVHEQISSRIKHQLDAVESTLELDVVIERKPNGAILPGYSVPILIKSFFYHGIGGLSSAVRAQFYFNHAADKSILIISSRYDDTVEANLERLVTTIVSHVRINI